MITAFISRNKVGMFLVLVSAILWAITGYWWYMIVGAAALLVTILLRAMPRTILWAALAGYGAIAVPNGWFLVIVLVALVACFPMLRRITPIGDFQKPKVKA